MKILNKKTRIVNVVVTGIDNDSMTFATVQEAAKFLDVTDAMIYRALKNGSKVRGCTIATDQ